MPSKSILPTSAYLFIAALLLSCGEHNVLGQASTIDRDCQEYSDTNTTSATCDRIPGEICTGRCTGFVTATNCTRSQAFNSLEPPITTEKCTLAFSKSTATSSICLNEKFLFNCYGSYSGQAHCKKCGPINGAGAPPSTNGTAGTAGTDGTTTPPPGNTSTPAPKDKVTTTSTSTSNAGTSVTTATNASPTSSASTTGANVLALLATSCSALLW